jgi:phosphatidylserine/phosphatidylglycerophosphate/cardiolipin synthase-like enzyme
MQEILIGREYPETLTRYVKNAKQSIKILIYDWRFYPNEVGASIQKFNYEILQARKRGVEVSAIVNSDYPCLFFQNEKIKVRRINSKKTMHIKLIIIDQKYLFLGSHNLTKNAFELNHEMSLLIDDASSILKA